MKNLDIQSFACMDTLKCKYSELLDNTTSVGPWQWTSKGFTSYWATMGYLKFGNLPGGHERDQHTSFSLQAKDEMLQRPQPWLNTSRLSFTDLQKML